MPHTSPYQLDCDNYCNLDVCCRNHKSCQLLRSFILEAMGFYGLLCLKAITLKGFLVLMMASNSSKELNRENKNSYACSLHVLNPKTSKVVQLEQFCRSERTSIVGTNGQLIAAVGQRKGEVIMWNINSSHRHATLQAFEGMQLLIYLRLALRKKKTSTSGLHLSKAPFPPLDYI
ncbi:PREDICTED: uncharacterized protein LOC107342393 [Acropora digitifera]|uniref:uncharacterized protein LOC107342393 n=1 Tax=Acropora digitifera TaxID=70779 RepID=UPI00077ADA17|nr:PREDICTED: uncharacterized protein LOC107342393 [Acropora digitifera]